MHWWGIPGSGNGLVVGQLLSFSEKTFLVEGVLFV